MLNFGLKTVSVSPQNLFLQWDSLGMQSNQFCQLTGATSLRPRMTKPSKLHPKIPRLFHCKNRFWVITESIFKIESFKRCQNDRTNGAVIWYFHHHCVLFELAEQSQAPDSFFSEKRCSRTSLFVFKIIKISLLAIPNLIKTNRHHKTLHEPMPIDFRHLRTKNKEDV